MILKKSDQFVTDGHFQQQKIKVWRPVKNKWLDDMIALGFVVRGTTKWTEM